MASGRVTVLLFSVAAYNVASADGDKQSNLRLFEFTSEFYLPPMGRGRLDGLMASDGSRQRIDIYWIEPALYRDHTYFLGYSDFIFTKEKVHYWIHGATQPATLNLSDVNNIPLLPRDVSPESVARSALAIANLAHSYPQNDNVPLEVGKFFHKSRDHSDYSYEIPSKQAGDDALFDSNVSDVLILNNLPFGRQYSKETQSDGTLIWRAQTILNGPPIATITIKPVRYVPTDDANDIFDPNMLGRWMLIPGPYRAYWSFDQAYSMMKDEPDNAARSRELHDKIETYLAKNKVPYRIDLAFNQLLFKTSLLTGDTDRVSRSAHGVVTSIQRDDSINSYQGLLELARIDVQIRKRYPKEADDLICPLIGLMVRCVGTNAPEYLERLMPSIKSNKWFAFGKLLDEEIHVQGMGKAVDTDSLTTQLEIARFDEEIPPYDPSQEGESVKQYISQLDADPPKGALTLDNVRDVLRKGLEKPFADAKMELKPELIENVIRSIQLIAGEGPFRGDEDKLIKSVEQFSGLYLVVDRTREPIDTVLATFLGLSFYDTSKEEDHGELFSQIHKIFFEFRAKLNSTLDEHGLRVLVEPNDIKDIFGLYERKFRQYIDDPFWPAFKFPLSANEQIRLRNILKQRFDQLKPLFEEMSLKVKYGGASKELKDKTVYQISLSAQQLLPQTAFLRRPPYPGISCQYRGKYGFTAVIEGSLYREGGRPREKFKVMRYFHVGHRIEDIVKRERELAAAQ